MYLNVCTKSTTQTAVRNTDHSSGELSRLREPREQTPKSSLIDQAQGDSPLLRANKQPLIPHLLDSLKDQRQVDSTSLTHTQTHSLYLANTITNLFTHFHTHSCLSKNTHPNTVHSSINMKL